MLKLTKCLSSNSKSFKTWLSWPATISVFLMFWNKSLGKECSCMQSFDAILRTSVLGMVARQGMTSNQSIDLLINWPCSGGGVRLERLTKSCLQPLALLWNTHRQRHIHVHRRIRRVIWSRWIFPFQKSLSKLSWKVQLHWLCIASKYLPRWLWVEAVW